MISIKEDKFLVIFLRSQKNVYVSYCSGINGKKSLFIWEWPSLLANLPPELF